MLHISAIYRHNLEDVSIEQCKILTVSCAVQCEQYVFTQGINFCNFVYTVASDCATLIECMCSEADAVPRARSRGRRNGGSSRIKLVYCFVLLS